MLHQIHPNPFIIHPPDDLVQTNLDLKQISRRLANKYVEGEIVTDADLQIMGRMLWQTVDLHNDFDIACSKAGAAILPVIVESASAAVQALPWETLYHPEHRFLGRHPAFLLTRRITARNDNHIQLQKGPLRVLLFTSLPEDVDPERARLNVEEEQIQVQEALLPWITKGLVQLEMPDDGRFSTLQALLKNFQPHLVFLSGHGHFQEIPHTAEAYGEFLFESDSGNGDAIRDDQIAQIFKGTDVQAVVLSACESGKAADALSSGLTHKISAQGIPYVIGMRESILDAAGIVFTRNFCNALANQESVEFALQFARRGVSEADKRAQWCLPMLMSAMPFAPLIDWSFQPAQIDGMHHFSNTLGTVRLPERFIGRRAELRKMKHRLLTGELDKLLITGAGGQGKTSLAGKLALDLQTHGWQVFAWSANSGKPWRDFELEMERTLEKSRIDRYNKFLSRPKHENEHAKLLLKLLMEQFHSRVVLFLDNLESVQDPGTQVLKDPQTADWISAARETQHLILLATSRWQIPDWNDDHLQLAQVNYGDFLQMAQRLRLPRHMLESGEELRQIYKVLGGNGRGLEFFAVALQKMQSIEEADGLLDLLAKTKTELQAHMAISEIYKRLPIAVQTLLRRLPAFHVPVPLEGLIRLGTDLPDPQTLVEHLLAVSLLEESSAPDQVMTRYQCHPLVLDWLNEQNLIDASTTWLNTVADYHVELLTYFPRALFDALAAYHALHRAKRHPEADRVTMNHIVAPMMMAGSYRRLLDEFLPDICKSNELPIRARALAHMGMLLKITGEYQEALSRQKDALQTMRQIKDKMGEGATLNNIGQIHYEQGQYRDALSYFQRALTIQQQIADKAGEQATLNNIATVYQAQGDYGTAFSYLKRIESQEGAPLSNLAYTYYGRGEYDTALLYLKQALANQNRISNRGGAATTLNNISQIYRAQNNHETALKYLKQALVIQEEISDRPGESITRNNMAEIYVRQGEYQKALKDLEQVLVIQQQMGDKAKSAITLNNISGIYRRRSDNNTALAYLNQALAIQEEIGDWTGKGTTLNNIASVYQARGDFETALARYTQSLEIRKKLGDKAGEAQSLNNIATIYQAQGKQDRIWEGLIRALEIFQQLGNQSGESTTLNNIALVHQARGEYGMALDTFKKSLRITQEIGDLIGESATLDNIGMIYQAGKEYSLALNYLRQAQAIRHEIGDRAGEGQSLNNLSRIYHSLGDYEKALAHLQRARTILEEIGHQRGLCITFLNMGHAYLKKEQDREAMDAWLNAFELAQQTNQMPVLQALDEFAPKVGLRGGLSDWERLSQKRKLGDDANLS